MISKRLFSTWYVFGKFNTYFFSSKFPLNLSTSIINLLFSRLANHIGPFASLPFVYVHNKADFHFSTWNHKFSLSFCSNHRNFAAQFVRLYGRPHSSILFYWIFLEAIFPIFDGHSIAPFLCLAICPRRWNVFVGFQWNTKIFYSKLFK
jgi:hypothetical protein